MFNVTLEFDGIDEITRIITALDLAAWGRTLWITKLFFFAIPKSHSIQVH